ncbi:tetratricopeptide repeat protein [Micromonospora terminaliae]|uniref:Tetratricopeptide repeat protein n=1 Tax=Micromonospora terminaliae TaxID=1914461 RepID=A0AAJ2ZDZ2_9ACTN|nr:tetratricopeptide repeat protein [Micromonospora terminaliae]NES27179.1 tetratricopeptide repeat protein [Micromonospora terminaliae]QGL48059.1 tetratricopeptide repeat protein [Micromonospora terminaliae]
MSSLALPHVTFLGGHPRGTGETTGLTAVLDRSGIDLRRPIRRFLRLPWPTLRGLDIRTPSLLSMALDGPGLRSGGAHLDLHLDQGICRLHVPGTPAPELRERLAAWAADEAGPPAPLPGTPPPPPRQARGPADVVRMSLDIWRAAGVGREGVPDRNTLAYRLSVAEDHRHCGRFTEALALLEPLAAGATAAFGPLDKDTLAVRNELGQAYLAAGQVDDGLDVLREALAAAEHGQGADDDLTLVVRNNLAVGYQQAGQYAQAVELHERNIRHSERRHGRQSRQTVGRRNNLAATLALAGYRRRAIALYWEVLDALPAGDDNLAVTARQNLAILHNPTWRP